MANLAFFENMIENKLMSLHTAFLAKVLSVNSSTAKIQPLGKTKAYGGKAQPQASLSNVPMLKSVEDLATGDIVFCVCCERDITEAKRGNNSVPAIGRHSMSDSVIVGILKG